jgi:hypothetical protein
MPTNLIIAMVALPVALMVLWRVLNTFLRVTHRNASANLSEYVFARFTSWFHYH